MPTIKKKMTVPIPGEEVVITGIAGRFPDSNDVHEFRNNLYNKVDLVSDDDRRWTQGTHSDIPQRTGKIHHLNKFDAGFFGVHQNQVQTLDSMSRIILEKCFEAILDAGINPKELYGSRTGVYIGACFSEFEKTAFYDLKRGAYGIMGSTRSMLAQRINYFYGFNGPSYICDSACSSSLFAFDRAYRDVREGRCESAIVGGCNLCLHPLASQQFFRLGVLSPDGACKSFDNSANGYARSEGIVVVLLQKAKDARRIYAEVIHTKTNCDGYKEQGITYPSGKEQKVLLDEFYQECGISPNTVTYVEAHGTGTKVGDPEELGTIDQVFCTGRDRPLHIGSVKSNIGHNEPVSGLCSIIKIVLAMENGFIPPNLHFKKHREGVEGLETGRLKVVSEKTPIPDNVGLFAVNSFGFGGANSHLLLKWNSKVKNTLSEKKDLLPRLVCISGRNDKTLDTMFEFLGPKWMDYEYISLLHNIYKSEIQGNYFRGFAIVGKNIFYTSKGVFSEQFLTPVTLVFNGLDTTWPTCIRSLQGIPLFAAHIQKIHQIVQTNKLEIDIPTLLNNYDEKNLIHSILTTIIVQTGLTDILKIINFPIKSIVGMNIGELSSSYAEGKLNLEQTILAAFYFAISQLDSEVLLEYLKKFMSLGQAITLVETLFNRKSFSICNDFYLIIGKDQNMLENRITLIDRTITDFLTSLGRLFELGFYLDLANLYPPIKFPVSRGTPMISPLISWDHDKDWFVAKFIADEKKGVCKKVEISLRDENWTFVRGHIIDGRNLFPATGYLHIVSETLSTITGKLINEMNIVFENVKFLRACTVSSKSILFLNVMISKGSGYFEVFDDGAVVVSGTVYETDNYEEEICTLPIPDSRENEVILTGKDIYKEFRLRGYNYKEKFKAVKEFYLGSSYGKIVWDDNWISFMDNMLQLQLLLEDTRNLYVPTRIDRVIINPKRHIHLAETHSNLFPAYVYRDLHIIKSGGIEIRGLTATCIARRKQPNAVLEVHKFVPNNSKFSIKDSIRILVQMALENHSIIKVKTVEVHSRCREILSPLIMEVLADLPLIQPETFIHLDEPIDVPSGITVDERKFGAVTDCDFLVASGILSNYELRVSALSVLKPTGFVFSRENLGTNFNCEDMTILSTHTTPTEIIILAKRKNPEIVNSTIRIDSSFDWLAELKEKTNSDVILYSQNNPESGILGLINCLRREPNGERFKCFFILDEAPSFDINNEFYKEQLDKDLAINIYKDGQWGTYKHLRLEDSLQTMSEYSYVNVTTTGDLSSLRWIQSGLTSKNVMESEKILVNVYTSALNFRDIMTASGRIQSDVVTNNRREQDCILGIEFAGRDQNGHRVMGMVTSNALATIVVANTSTLWTIPEAWSMEEAVTVPAVYGTVLCGLILRAKLKYGQSILIHSGTGGVGLAAINVCLHYGCTIFVTVGTDEKREFIKKNYPRIKPSHIGNSRDCSFEKMIHKETKGRGVDIVINSLADDKLQASIRCLADGGHFIEIGKFDLASDSPLSLNIANKKCHFHGLMLDNFMKDPYKVKNTLQKLLQDGIDSGAVKPLPRTCFGRTEIENAFRFMSHGKHIGKVIIKVRPEESETLEKYSCLPRYWCDANSTYIVIGGLGGFGLELVDWLILRGAHKIVINSRRGLATGYQALRIRIWQTYGILVQISIDNIQTYEGVQDLLKEAEKLGPVKAIFNLAVNLCDGLLENQTIESFRNSAAPKALATQYLDMASRKICPNLENFVVFSSVSCGRGNAGQTNYGWSNSVMERICERRKACNLPALAIQWGAVGDVGLVADMQDEDKEQVIAGTLQQRISSCLEVLDAFLNQQETVVSSMVVAEKKSKAAAGDNIVDIVVSMLGLRDLKTVSLHSTLPELGMDSMMAVEIKQTLEREYDIFLTPQDIRSLTIARLQEMTTKSTDTLASEEEMSKAAKLLLRFIVDEKETQLPYVLFPSLSANSKSILLFPGIEGTACTFEALVKNIKSKTVSFQYCYNNNTDVVQSLVQQLLPIVEEQLAEEETFTIIGYSFGSIVALELTHILEKTRKGTLILIDGSPLFMKKLIENQLDTSSEENMQISLLCHLMSAYVPYEEIEKYKGSLLSCANFEERIQLCISPKIILHSPEYIKTLCIAALKRIKAIYTYTPSMNSLQSEVILLRPKIASVSNIKEDYELSSIVGKKVAVKFFEGDHVSILANIGVAEEINKILQDKIDIGKDTADAIPLTTFKEFSHGHINSMVKNI